MVVRSIPQLYEHIDRQIAGFLARHSISLLRWSMGIVFIWFGALKFIPGLSPAEGLIRASVQPVAARGARQLHLDHLR